MEVNGKVIDQLPQLIHRLLNIEIKNCYRNKNSPKPLKRKIRNAIMCECKLKPFWRSSWAVCFPNTWCQRIQVQEFILRKIIMNVYQELATNAFPSALFITV